MNDNYNNYEPDYEELVEEREKQKKKEAKKNKKSKKKLNKKTLIILIIAVVLLIGVGGVLLISFNGESKYKIVKGESLESAIEKPKVQIVDLEDTRRPIAMMINNHHDAWPQAGLSDAYIIYELMVEGGITRMMALYTQDKDVKKIGSARSARHNYLDYALESDAIYVHFGGSTYAYNDIKKLGVDDIDGNTFANKYFYRDKTLNRSIEHTAFTTSANLKKAIADLKYRNERKKDYLLNYTTDEVDLSKIANNKVANKVSIKYSYYQTSSYEYNSDEKVYYRFMGGQKHTDLVTGEQYKFKNIIVYSVKYTTISKKGHQDLSNVGSGKGYYITNGYAIPITWTKPSRTEATVYKYENGEEIDVSDGNTFIQIYPTTGTLTIS